MIATTPAGASGGLLNYSTLSKRYFFRITRELRRKAQFHQKAPAALLGRAKRAICSDDNCTRALGRKFEQVDGGVRKNLGAHVRQPDERKDRRYAAPLSRCHRTGDPRNRKSDPTSGYFSGYIRILDALDIALNSFSQLLFALTTAPVLQSAGFAPAPPIRAAPLPCPCSKPTPEIH